MLVARPPNTARCRGGCSGDAALVVCCCRGRPSTAGLLAAVETARRTSFATVPVWIYGSTTVWVYNTRAMDGGSCLAIPISIVIIVEPSQLSNAAKPREHPKKPHSNAWRLGHRLELRPQEGRHQEELRDRGGRRRGAGARGVVAEGDADQEPGRRGARAADRRLRDAVEAKPKKAGIGMISEVSDTPAVFDSTCTLFTAQAICHRCDDATLGDLSDIFLR